MSGRAARGYCLDVPWPKRVAVALWVATGMLAALGAWASFTNGRRFDVLVYALSITTAGVPLIAGLLVIRHDRDNWVGTCLTAAGTAIVLINAHGAWQDALAADPSSLPASPLLFVLTQGVWMAWFVPYALAIALFPDGRPWGRLGRFSVIGLIAIPVLFNLLTSVVPGPLMPPLEDWPRPLGTHPIGYVSLGLLPVFLAALIGAGVSLWRRHRATRDSRAQAQLRWMLLASTAVPATLVLCWLGYLVTGGPTPVVIGLIAMNVFIPAATLIAMLRHDLYDVDRAVVLTGAYAVLAAGVLVTYAVVSGVLGRALGAGSVTAAVAATVAVMVALLPARAFLLRVLGRWFHPRREAGLRAIHELGERVNDGTAQPELLERTLRTALRDNTIRVGYRRPGGTAYEDVAGRHVDREHGQLIESAGHPVAVVTTDAGTPIPADVLGSARLLADSVRLRRELAVAVDEVDASRERIIRAGYEERRKLEMDLHDGAQQRLVSLGMRMRVAQHRLHGGQPVEVDGLLDAAVSELAEAVVELRAIAHGLRPSSLVDGLPAALESLSRNSVLPIELSCDTSPLPDHVSLTGYYVASEALANAVKHASADHVWVTVCREDDAVRIKVRDNGVGGASVAPGSGLARLRDRVQALGGDLAVTSPTSEGTTLEAVIPCGS